MGKKRRILVAALIIAVLGAVAWIVVSVGRREPVYKGHPVSYWLRHPKKSPMLTGSGGTNGYYLDFAFPRMDSKAVPFLVRELETQDGRLKELYGQFWPDLPSWLQRHTAEPAPASEVRAIAATKLRFMGADAKPAIPALLRAFENDEDSMVRDDALAALLAVGSGEQTVTEALTNALTNNNPRVRQMAASALKKIQQDAAAKAGVQ